MLALERIARQSFRNVILGLLGRYKADYYEDEVERLLQAYCKRVSLKINVFLNTFFQT